MAKHQDLNYDVLVLGGHPSGYLAAALLRHKSKLRVLHCTIPGEHAPDRLLLINPELFSLHPLVEGLKRRMDLSGIYGLRFLSGDPAVASEYRSKSASACVGQLKELRGEMHRLAADEGAELLNPKTLQIQRIHEKGLEVQAGNALVKATALVLAGVLSEQQHRMLGLPEEWERGVVAKYSFVCFKGTKYSELGNKPLVPLTLDLNGKLIRAWMLVGPKHTQLAVEHSAQFKAIDLLKLWVAVLEKHGLIKGGLEIGEEQVQSVDVPLAGALAHEGVANRALLIGPAGGFYSASAEDAYPCCWSAIFAAEVLKKSLKEPHLQDALQAYRQRWRTTLGDYLRGPQMDLRFLLPLVYRNQEMTNRLAEAILSGKSIVR